MELKKTIRISKDTVSRAVNDQEVLLNMTTGQYFGLDEIGTAIWQNIKAGLTADEIAEELSAEFEVSAAQAKADVSELTGELYRNGLIES
jgi:hypothetical protein